MIFSIRNESDVKQLLDTLESTPKLESVDMVGNHDFKLKAIDISAIFAYINKSNQKIILKFIKGLLNQAALKVLVQEMRTNNTVATLNLSDSYPLLDDENGVMIAFFLKENTTLRSLNLSDNTFCANAGAAFAEALMSNETLTDLNLARISNDTVEVQGLLSSENKCSLSAMLAVNKTLQSLCLRCHVVTNNKDMVAFAQSININKTLVNLDVDYCFIDDPEMFLSLAFKDNQTLRTLDFGSNQADGDSIDELLSRNTSLTDLSLAGIYYLKDLMKIHKAIDIRDTPLRLSIDTGCHEKAEDEEQRLYSPSWDAIVEKIEQTRQRKMHDRKMKRECVTSMLRGHAWNLEQEILELIFAMADIQNPYRVSNHEDDRDELEDDVDKISEEEEYKTLAELSYSLGYSQKEDDKYMQEVREVLQKIDKKLQGDLDKQLQPSFTPSFSSALIMQMDAVASSSSSSSSSAPTKSLKRKNDAI